MVLINSVSITKLFGLYDYQLNFQDGIQFICGSNGIGKSILFKTLVAVLNNDHSFIETIPFENFKIETTNNVAFEFNKRIGLLNHPFLISTAYIHPKKLIDLDEEYLFNNYPDKGPNLELFINIINHFFERSNKFIGFDYHKQQVVVFYKEKFFPYSLLSDGEKQLINIFYWLLLRLRSEAFVVIDCPETFFYVSWLIELAQLFEKVIELKKHRLILITNSPDLIGDRWDLTTTL